jgi:hypothetical protein
VFVAGKKAPLMRAPKMQADKEAIAGEGWLFVVCCLLLLLLLLFRLLCFAM